MSLAESLEGLRKVDLADLDLNNLGSWPAAVKAIACLLLLIVVLALGYNFHLKDLEADLDQRHAVLCSTEAVRAFHDCHQMETAGTIARARDRG